MFFSGIKARLPCYLNFILLALILSSIPARGEVSGTRSALVMLVSLTDAPIDCSVGEVNGLVFTNTPLNVDAFYDHATWGNVRWSGNVIAVSIPFSKDPCNADAWANAADAQAQLQGYNPGSYDARVYALPSAAGSCGYAFASGNRVWNFHCSDLFAYGHEMGHTVGMNHASTDRNNDGVIEGEYGGLDDCMGGESYTFNAPHKIWGGWLPQKSSNGGWRQVVADGVYALSPLEINPASNPPYSQALKIVPPTGPAYYLSYRQPLDFDLGWTASQVGKDGRSGTIVDPVPPISAYPFSRGVTIHRFNGGTGDHTLEIAVLADNQQYAIPGTGIVIRQLAHDANRVAVHITGVSGGTAPLGVTFYQDTLYGGAQSQVLGAGNYTLSQLAAKGVPNDWASSCKVPPGWTLVMYQNDSFSGTSWTRTGDTADFTALSPNANDQMTSCRVLQGAIIPPESPAELAAIPGDTQVSLFWTATPGATGYRVKRASSGAGPFFEIATPPVSGFVDTGLINGVTYYYVVGATNNVGGSADSTPVVATPVSDLVAHWRFDERVGNVTADSSGNNNTGTLLNTPAWVAPGKLGTAALLFNAASRESVTAPNSSSLNSPSSAITIAAWINAIDWNGNRRIVQKGNSDNQYRLLAEGGVLKFHLNGVDTLTAALPPTGTWIHIAGTWDGSTMRLFTNGIEMASKSAGGNINTTSDPIAIAKKNGSSVSGDYFNGRLDDVRIYNRALDASEISLILYDAPPSFATDPFSAPAVTAGQPYSSSIASSATDPNGDAFGFGKVSGPAWLNIGSSGALSGMPLSVNVGTNSFIVRATDVGNLTSTATMTIVVEPAPPIVATISLQGEDLLLDWSGGIAPYQVQVAAPPALSDWQNSGSEISGNSVLIKPTNTAAFYRIIGQ